MKLKKLLSMMLVVALVVTTASFTPSAVVEAKAKKKYVKSIKVAKTVTVTKGKSKTVKVKVKVSGKASKKFTAKIKNNGVASAKKRGNKLIIKGKKAGSTKIVIKSKGKGKKGKKLKKTIKIKVQKQSNKLSVNLGKLESDCTDFVMGQKSDTIFTITSKNVKGSLGVYENNKKIATMNDKGQNGDEVANDGKYSCKATVYSSNSKKGKYLAKSDNGKSSELVLNFYKIMSDNDREQLFEEVSDELNDIEAKYEDNNGYVEQNNVSNVLSEAEKYAQNLVKNDKARYIEKNEDNLIIKLSSGESIVCMPNVEGNDSAGSNDNISITTCQPCLSGYSSNLSTYMGLPDQAASSLKETFDFSSFDNNYDDGEVDLEAINDFSSNQIIIWHGHGGYSKTRHSFLVTGQKNYWHYVFYWFDDNDYVKDGVMYSDDGSVMVTSRYFEKHCGNLSGSLIYLAACDSGKDKVLAKTLIKKGAKAVVVNTDTIKTVYNLKVQNAVITNLTKFSDSTGDFYTLKEALSEAKKQVGTSDKSYGGVGAYPYIVGDNADNYRVGQIRGSVKGYDIVLTWGENPEDLDSHLVSKYSDDTIHVYFEEQDGYYNDNKVCELDYDDTTSYGPEVISVNTDNTKACYYYVHRYDGDGYLSSSNALVRVYKNGVLLKTYKVPNNGGTGDYWNVFAIKNGSFVERNTITDDPDTSY